MYFGLNKDTLQLKVPLEVYLKNFNIKVSTVEKNA